MDLKEEAVQALSDGKLASTLIQSINWVWLVIALGIPIFGMIIYKYLLTNIADRFVLFVTNKPWTDKGKLIEFNRERWIIDKVGIFRVYLIKSSKVENRGKTEIMKKTYLFIFMLSLITSIIALQITEFSVNWSSKSQIVDEIIRKFCQMPELNRKFNILKPSAPFDKLFVYEK